MFFGFISLFGGMFVFIGMVGVYLKIVVVLVLIIVVGSVFECLIVFVVKVYEFDV